MLTTFLVVVPVLFILFGAVGALSFAMSDEHSADSPAQGAEAIPSAVEAEEHLLLFEGPDMWRGTAADIEAAELGVERLLAMIESDLRAGRRSAELFARSPSRSTLHIN